MIRLHLPTPLSADAGALPTLDQSRYLTQVLRLELGDRLLVFNGRRRISSDSRFGRVR